MSHGTVMKMVMETWDQYNVGMIMKAWNRYNVAHLGSWPKYGSSRMCFKGPVQCVSSEVVTEVWDQYNAPQRGR